MNNADIVYLGFMERVLNEGEYRDDRTGAGTISLFGETIKFDLQEGFPLLTTKKISFRLPAEELLWFLRGSADLKELVNKNVNIWNKDGYRIYLNSKGPKDVVRTYEEFVEHVKYNSFDLGMIYGRTWRDFNNEGVDQIKNVVNSIKNDPYSRRHIVTAWNPAQLDEMALPPCPTMFQFYVSESKYLKCVLYQRSADCFLGLPFDIASYALLTHIIAEACGLEAKELTISIGDAHIYKNHVEQVKEQIRRSPHKLPKLRIITPKKNLEDYTMDDFELLGYVSHEPIKAPLNVGK